MVGQRASAARYLQGAAPTQCIGRHSSRKVFYTPSVDKGAVTEKATKNVRKTGVEDKNVQEDDFDSSEE